MSADSGKTGLFRVRTEQAAVTVLDDEFARVPGRVRETPRELDTMGDKLGV